MLIDCDSCVVRGAACADCVVTVLLGSAPDTQAPGSASSAAVPACPQGSEPPGVPAAVTVDTVSVAALAALAEGGLVPPLRLVLPETGTG